MLAEALNQAKDARNTLLDVMREAIDGPDEMSIYAPRIITMKIPVDKIGEVIGPKGKVINQIQDDTGAEISIEDDGTIYVGADQAEKAEAARTMINAIANPTNPEKVSGTSARLSRSPLSAPSSRCCRARTACCISPNCARSLGGRGLRMWRTCSASDRRFR